MLTAFLLLLLFNKPHRYVGQENWHEPVLRNTVLMPSHTGNTTAVVAVGVYDCVTRSICAYANPAP